MQCAPGWRLGERPGRAAQLPTRRTCWLRRLRRCPSSLLPQLRDGMQGISSAADTSHLDVTCLRGVLGESSALGVLRAQHQRLSFYKQNQTLLLPEPWGSSSSLRVPTFLRKPQQPARLKAKQVSSDGSLEGGASGGRPGDRTV